MVKWPLRADSSLSRTSSILHTTVLLVNTRLYNERMLLRIKDKKKKKTHVVCPIQNLNLDGKRAKDDFVTTTYGWPPDKSRQCPIPIHTTTLTAEELCNYHLSSLPRLVHITISPLPNISSPFWFWTTDGLIYTCQLQHTQLQQQHKQNNVQHKPKVYIPFRWKKSLEEEIHLAHCWSEAFILDHYKFKGKFISPSRLPPLQHLALSRSRVFLLCPSFFVPSCCFSQSTIRCRWRPDEKDCG